MFWTEMLFAFCVAVIISAVSFPVLGRRRVWDDESWLAPLFVFVLLFLISWAGGIWIGPLGPALYGVYWVPFMIGALLYLLLLAVVMGLNTPTTHKSIHEEYVAEEEREDVARGAAGVFFGLLAVILVACIVTHYVT